MSDRQFPGHGTAASCVDTTDDWSEMEAAAAADESVVLSVCWEQGQLAAAFYHLATMELSIFAQAIDLRPEYAYLHNICRQLRPITTIASGPKVFRRHLMSVHGITADIDDDAFKASAPTTGRQTLVFYGGDTKTLADCRRRVMDLRLPGLPPNATDSQRNLFVQSVLPINQTLVVHALGNLLAYIDTNRRQLELTEPLRVADMRVFRLDAQVLIDEPTFVALQILPHGEWTRVRNATSRPGTTRASIFTLFNRCVSAVGTAELRRTLLEPTRDTVELAGRYATIAWAMDDQNGTLVTRIKHVLKRVANVGVLYRRIVGHSLGGRTVDWQRLKNTVHNVCVLCEMVADLQTNRMPICPVLAAMVELPGHRGGYLKNVFHTVDKVVDMEPGVTATTVHAETGNFTVRHDFDVVLDRKRAELAAIQAQIYDTTLPEIKAMPFFVYTYTVTFIEEFGFVLGIPKSNLPQDTTVVASDSMKLVLQDDTTLFYSTPLCVALSKRYGHLYTAISEHETRIAGRLVNYVGDNLCHLSAAIKLCASLDCLTAMAAVAVERGYVQPEIVPTQRAFTVHRGRHALFEVYDHDGAGEYQPNDTTVDDGQPVTILTAANAAGKSVYLKQIALIAYLAHIGSFVPATAARLPLLDSIYSRMYSGESVHQTTSSFLVDLQQMSRVMMNSTARSLILIDEFGKGTNVAEGRALLVACIESLVARATLTPITFVTTHYREIYELLAVHKAIAFKTFEMGVDAGGVCVSKYRLIDGHSTADDGDGPFDMPAVQSLVGEGVGDSQSAHNSTHCLNSTIDLIKSLYLFKSRIQFAYDIVKVYLKRGSVDATEIFTQLDQTKVFRDNSDESAISCSETKLPSTSLDKHDIA